MFTPTEPVATPAPAASQEKTHIFLINFYRRYFDLDSETFVRKLRVAANPFREIEEYRDEPLNNELYGFIWITGTLVLMMFISTTGTELLIWDSEHLKFTYDFNLLTKSVTLFYGYNLIVPTLLYVASGWIFKFPEPMPLVQTISIYGYTNILWLPITCVNFVLLFLVNVEKRKTLLSILEWFIVGVSGVITCFSNIHQLSPIIKRNCLINAENNVEQATRQHALIIGLLTAAHLLFTVIVKWSYFGLAPSSKFPTRI